MTQTPLVQSNDSIESAAQASSSASATNAVAHRGFTSGGPIVVLAPHAGHPPMDGASYRSWSIAKEFGRAAGRDCYYFAKEEFFKVLPDGSTEKIDALTNRRGKNMSALRTIVRQSNYQLEKHLSWAWISRTEKWLGLIKPGMLFINFFWAWNKGWGMPAGVPIYVDTHNYDPEWWNNLKKSSKNLVSSQVCALSCANALKTLSELPVSTKLIHVTTKDHQLYLEHRPDMQHIVLANGCDIQFRQTVPDYTETPKRLYFLGALNITITQDALKWFAERFWPALKGTCEMHIFGSGETAATLVHCNANGWTLHHDLPDDQLAKELEKMHYLVLPFAYTAGSKLKMINACGKGIPVIATPHGVFGFNSVPPTVFVSEDPDEWVKAVARPTAPSEADLLECRKFADTFSWQRLVKDAKILEDPIDE